MNALAPLPVAIPFAAAAVIAATHRHLKHRLLDLLAVATSLAVCGICVKLAVAADGSPVVHWFGGWIPAQSEPVGIAFVVQPIGAWIAALAGLLVAGSFVFSWRYFEDVAGLFHAIVLVFLGGMCGFCLTGDLFNLFVFFEVMGVSAFALTGYKNDLRGAIQGAISFAVTNSVAAILMLFGIALVYAQTGALNMARAGQLLEARPLDAVTLVGFTLIVVGLLTKAAQFPFHLWLPDAHSVAPVPISVLFSGVMVLLGFWGVAHVYWIVFHGALASQAGLVRGVLLTVALCSTIGGALSALLQTDLKRMLAFSTISHGGAILAGIALLSAEGLAGASTNLVGEGLLKGALFMLAGRLLNRHGATDLHKLHGKGRKHPGTATLYFLAVLGLTGLPGFIAWAGEAFIEEAARSAGYAWLRYPLLASAAVAGGALLSAGCRVFFGWGPRPEEEDEEHAGGAKARSSDEHAEQRPTLEMLFAPGILVALAIGLTFVPSLGSKAERWATQLTQVEVTTRPVLHGDRPQVHPSGALNLKGKAVLPGVVTCAVAAAVAAFWLERKRLPHLVRRGGDLLVAPLRWIQSGDVCDYVLWMSLGLAVVGAVWVLGSG